MILKDGKIRNDIIKGLKMKVQFPSSTATAKEPKIAYRYLGKYGQGYDGCGSHTHDD